MGKRKSPKGKCEKRVKTKQLLKMKAKQRTKCREGKMKDWKLDRGLRENGKGVGKIENNFFCFVKRKN